jgi:hypothetical protein
MNSGPAGPPHEPSWALLELAGDEAILPAGIRLADEGRPGRQCFVLIEGTATVESAGSRLGDLSPGAFVGMVGQGGRPLPPSGLTVQLATRARVLVIDAERLAVLIDSDPAAAAAWRQMSQQALARPGIGLPRLPYPEGGRGSEAAGPRLSVIRTRRLPL